MTSRAIQQQRWHHKGRLVSMKNNLLQLIETSECLTDCERIQICRLVKGFGNVIEKFPERTASLMLEASGDIEEEIC